MWFPSLLMLLSLASFRVMAQFKGVEDCLDLLDFEDMEAAMELPDQDDIEILCPAILGFFDCIDKAVQEEVGLTLSDMVHLPLDDDILQGLNVVLNIRSLFQDLCDENSQLNREYRESSECYNGINLDPSTDCSDKADAAYEAYKQFEDVVQNEAGEDEDDDNRFCFNQAYVHACLAARIHEECGRRAFDTYVQIVKRTTLFRYAICSERQLDELKTKFVDKMDVDESQKNIFRLAFDLRRRRK